MSYNNQYNNSPMGNAGPYNPYMGQRPPSDQMRGGYGGQQQQQQQPAYNQSPMRPPSDQMRYMQQPQQQSYSQMSGSSGFSQMSGSSGFSQEKPMMGGGRPPMPQQQPQQNIMMPPMQPMQQMQQQPRMRPQSMAMGRRPRSRASMAMQRMSMFMQSNVPFGHEHFSDRLPWLRASVLGANDGLVSTAAIMLGITIGNGELQLTILSGVSSLVAGSLAMAAGEYVSVASQLDTEKADIAREKEEFEKGPAHMQKEMDDLIQVYIARGLKPMTARLVAEELHEKPIEEIVKAHARDELGINTDELADPFEASWTSALSYSVGAALPLLAGAFIQSVVGRVVSIIIIASIGLVAFGAAGSMAGGASPYIGGARVLIGGLIAMGGTMGVGKIFGVAAA